MSFIGSVGVVAQQGNQAVASAPTDVSLATSISSNYDDAVITKAYNGSTPEENIHMQEGVVASGSSIITELDITELNLFSAANYINIRIGAYLRATGATSYSYSLHDLTGQLGGVTTSLVTSSMSTTQNVLDPHPGIGGYVKIDAGGGRGGLTWGDADDWLQFKVRGTATNSAGSTSISPDITVKIIWTAGDRGD